VEKMEKEIKGINIEEITKQYFTNCLNEKYYKKNTFEIHVYCKKSKRKNSKYTSKNINFYCNNGKLNQYNIMEYLNIFASMKYNKSDCYGLTVWNNETLISYFNNITFYSLCRKFTSIVNLINNSEITLAIEKNLIEFK
jgi:hypothetical protein